MESPILIPGWPREWPCQQWTFQTLAELLKDKEVSCRIWEKSKSQVFETNCDHMKINLRHFYDWLEEKPNSDNPLFPYARTDYNCYIDYKYMKDMFASVPEIFDDVRWCDFGLTDFNGSDSTIWIGSEGSNTPCHQDSYGFNLVTQIQGRLFDAEPLETLANLAKASQTNDMYFMINDKRLIANGFKVKCHFDLNGCLQMELLEMCNVVPTYNIGDMKFVLEILSQSPDAQIHETRPVKVLYYLQGEAVRMMRQSKSCMTQEDVQELLNRCLDFPNQTCLHDKPILHEMITFSDVDSDEMLL